MEDVVCQAFCLSLPLPFRVPADRFVCLRSVMLLCRLLFEELASKPTTQ